MCCRLESAVHHAALDEARFSALVFSGGLLTILREAVALGLTCPGCQSVWQVTVHRLGTPSLYSLLDLSSLWSMSSE